MTSPPPTSAPRAGARTTPAGTDPAAAGDGLLVLGFALLTTIVEVAANAGLVPSIQIGALHLNASVVPALALAVVCGDRLLGRSDWRAAVVGYWIASTVLLALLAVAFLQRDWFQLWISLVTAALMEELVYRLAVPVVITTVLVVCRVDPGRARIAALVLAGTWFVVLPGHLQQLDGPGSVVALLGFTALATLVVYRSGSIIPMAAAHAISNLVTALLWGEAVGRDLRSLTVAAVLGLLVLAFARTPHRQAGEPLPRYLALHGPVEVLDLRDAGSPRATLGDGTVITVDDLDGRDAAAARLASGGPEGHHAPGKLGDDPGPTPTAGRPQRRKFSQ